MRPAISEQAPKEWKPGQCANCEADLPSSGPVRLYCTERCRQYAKDVRYFRACRQDGRFLDPAVQEKLSTRLAHLVSGGYDAAARRLPAEMRRQVLTSNGGKCSGCQAATAVEVDHIAGPSGRRDNLQGLCRPCHVAKTSRSIGRMGPTELDAKAVFRQRVEALMPLRPCDDELNWDPSHQERMAATKYWQLSQLVVEEIYVPGFSVPRDLPAESAAERDASSS